MSKFSGKKWILCVFLLILTGMIAFMAVNYLTDPVDYYAVSRKKETYNPNNYTRKIKSEYITREFPDVEGIILGGSKAGVLDPERIREYSGLSYYNFSFMHGNFSDYEIYFRYLLTHTQNLKEIMIHLSSIEVSYYSWYRDRTKDPDTKVPAMVSGNLWDYVTENLSHLCTDIHTTIRSIRKPDAGISRDTLATGQKNWLSAISKFNEDPEAFLEKNFYHGADKSFRELFSRKASGETRYYQENLDALKRIRQLCEENGVTLKVVIGASSIYERNEYECEEYLNYLRQVVLISGGAWDFSSYSDLNLNAANFYEKRHYTSQLGDLEIDIMYGRRDSADYDDFGIYLTADNVDSYIDQRRDDWKSLKETYESEGSLSLPGPDDPSYIAELS